MPIREPLMVKTSEAASSVSLSPDTGEAFRIIDVQVDPNAAVTEFLTFYIGRDTVGYFHVGNNEMNQLPFCDFTSQQETLMTFLQKQGIPMTYPVAEGETFTVEAPNNWTTLMIFYEIHDAGDIRKDMVNGSGSSELYFMQYGKNSSNVSATSYLSLDDVHNPVEFPNFPFGEAVPSRMRMDILSVLFPDVTRAGTTAGTDSLVTEFLRMYYNRRVLFDEDKSGLWVKGLTTGGAANTTTYYHLGSSSLPYTLLGGNNFPKLFPVPLEFHAGEELDIQLNFASDGGGATIQADDIYCGLLMHIVPTAR